MVRCPVCGHRFASDAHSPEATGRRGSTSLCVFRNEGEFWFVGFEADAFRLKDTKGLRYLSLLLGNPGREILALQLLQHAEGGPLPDSTGSGLGHDDGLRLFMPGDSGDVIDETARRSYEQRIRDLADEIEHAESWDDDARAGLLREEMEFIVQHLSASTGLGGSSRRMGNPAERSRQSVTKAIKSAVDRIAEHSTALERHLASTVRTGTYCIYQPDPRVPVSWRT